MKEQITTLWQLIELSAEKQSINISDVTDYAGMSFDNILDFKEGVQYNCKQLYLITKFLNLHLVFLEKKICKL